MTYLEAALLGLVQGLTEFLPVSSSGHLALGAALLGGLEQGGALFEVAVHLGTLGSIFVVFGRDVLGLFRALRHLLVPQRWAEAWRSDPSFRLGCLVVLSAIPAGVVGILAREPLQALFDQPRVVGGFLILTSAILFSTRFAPARERPIDARGAIVMGLAQAVAILPGVSRSGSTISAALWAGVKREEAGRFSFLMAIIPILGAGLLEAKDLGAPGATSLPVGPVLVGMLVAFLSGCLALRWLLRFVARGKLYQFAPYCLALGLFGCLYPW